MKTKTPQLDRYNKIVILESQLVQQREVVRLLEEQMKNLTKLIELLEETV